MGSSCSSCPDKELIADNHQSKFKVGSPNALRKLSPCARGVPRSLRNGAPPPPLPRPIGRQVINVDDDGNELGAGVMELTDGELVLHTHRRDDVRWPYLCLRRYGYDSNLFSFESGRRCQTGQGDAPTPFALRRRPPPPPHLRVVCACDCACLCFECRRKVLVLCTRPG